MAGAAEKPTPQQADPQAALPSGETTALLPAGEVPSIAPLARVLAPAAPARPPALPPLAAGTAVDAMRDEEIARTRLFIRMGWLLSLVGIGTVFVIDAPRALAIIFVTGVVLGMVVSFGFDRAFADPRTYTRRALLILAAICIINGHLAVLLYGAYSAAPLLIVIGIHFVARTEAEQIARGILASAVVCYAVIAAAIAGGVIADPGVFASDAAIDPAVFATGALFVLATFWLAYYTARQFRAASLAAIDDLQRATRLASQRAAMMDELLGDLERALRAGPGRHSDQVIGEYELGAVLGRGAMGEVYDARHTVTGAPAAVKLLRPGLAGGPGPRARFARELAAGRAVDSPHVVRILGGSAELAGGPPPYLAMERLRGHTLAEQLRREPRLPGGALCALAHQIGAALDAAAAAGVIHRDVKPTNLFRCDDGTQGGIWKILDFGVARFAAEPGGADERGVIGTPRYMAPEQALGQPTDPRADLHALGAVIYRSATGRHPYDAVDPAALLYAIVHRMPARPGALAELPGDFDRFCAIALAKSPAERFASGGALARALDAALHGALDPASRGRADALIRRRPWEALR